MPKIQNHSKMGGFSDYSKETGPQSLPQTSNRPGHILSKGSLALKVFSIPLGDTPDLLLSPAL